MLTMANLLKLEAYAEALRRLVDALHEGTAPAEIAQLIAEAESLLAPNADPAAYLRERFEERKS